MTTRVPPGNLTEHPEYQREKKLLIKTSHLADSSEVLTEAADLWCVSCLEKTSEQLTKEILGPPQTATEQGKTEGFREVQSVEIKQGQKALD